MPALDARSAVLAAQLQRGNVIRELHEAHKTPVPMLRVDAMIIAIALEHGATMIVTDNVDEFRKLARGRIEISPIPSVDEAHGITLPFGPPDGPAG